MSTEERAVTEDPIPADGTPATPHAGAQPLALESEESIERRGGDPGSNPSHDRRVGIAAMVGCVFAFSLMDAIGKWVAADLPVFQMLAVRSTVAVSLVLVLLPMMGGLAALRTAQPALHALRAALGVGAFVFFFAGLRALPLADGVTVAFGSPFILTALSAPILRERVIGRQWLAVALGFVGVLLIVRPAATGFRPVALLVVVSSVCYALSMILTRLMTRGARSRESSIAFVFYTLGGQALVGWAIAGLAWKSMNAQQLIWVAAMGAIGVAGNFGLTIAFRRAPVGVIAPFEYTALLWATILGFVVFGDLPSSGVWFGATLIVAAGLYSVRESRL